jgi:hypothetical protein
MDEKKSRELVTELAKNIETQDDLGVKKCIIQYKYYD